MNPVPASSTTPVSHAELQRLRRLSRRRSARSADGEFLADGPVLLAEALAAGARVRTVVVEPDLLDHPAVLAAMQAAVPVRVAGSGDLAKVLDLTTPRGVVAVVHSTDADPDELFAAAAAQRRPLLVAVALQDPGNLGTLVRVAEASGCVGVLTTPGSVDVHNPKTVRSTAGSVFRVPVAEGVEVDTVLQRCRTAGLPVVATVGRGGLAPEQAPLSGAVAVFVGAEAHGLPAAVVEASDVALTVPMEGRVESLNAAVAGSLVLFDAARQRRAPDTAAQPVGGTTGPVRHNEPTLPQPPTPSDGEPQR